MNDCRFTVEHEWLRREADGQITLGITDYAQTQLGDIVFVELPAVGASIAADANLVVIESVKAVGEIKLSVGGTIIAVNTRLDEEPELVNHAAESDGWLVRVELDDPSIFDTLLDAAAYQALIANS